MIGYTVTFIGKIEEGCYDGDEINTLISEVDKLNKYYPAHENEMEAIRMAMYRRTYNSAMVSEPWYKVYTDDRLVNVMFNVVIVSDDLSYDSTMLAFQSLGFIAKVSIKLPDGIKMTSEFRFSPNDPSLYFSTLVQSKFTTIDGHEIFNTQIGVSGFGQYNMAFCINSANDKSANGCLCEQFMDKVLFRRVSNMLIEYEEAREDVNINMCNGCIIPSPINFIMYNKYRSAVPMIIQLMYEHRLIPNRTFATIQIDDSTDGLPSCEFINKFFSGNSVCLHITGNPKPNVMKILAAYDRDISANVTLFWVFNTCPHIPKSLGFDKKKSKCRPYFYLTPTTFKGYTRTVREIMNFRCDMVYGTKFREKPISWIREYKKYTGEDIRNWIFSEDVINSVVDTVCTSRLNEVVCKANNNLSEHMSGPGWTNGGGKSNVPMIMRSNISSRKAETKDDNIESSPMERLEALVGLSGVKRQIKSIIAHHHMMSKYAELGMPVDKPVHNMAFYGNPGTAKTTCAKLIGEIFYQEGIIKSPKVNELTKEDLVGCYIGETSVKAKEAIKKATGGVLFLDEAYSMARSDTGGYAAEAVDELVAAMDKSTDVIYIFAGYEKEMKKFIEMNPGLASRIPNNMMFADYSDEELISIMNKMYERQGFKAGEGVEQEVTRIVDNYRSKPNFGNARLVRNIVERSIICHSINLDGKEDITEEAIRTITIDDMPSEEDISGISERKRSVGFIN